jgi:hypothetical protein
MAANSAPEKTRPTNRHGRLRRPHCGVEPLCFADVAETFDRSAEEVTRPPRVQPRGLAALGSDGVPDLRRPLRCAIFLFATCSVSLSLFLRERRKELSRRNRACQFCRMLRLEALAVQRNRQGFAVAVDLPSPGLERSAIATSPENDCVVLVGRHAGEDIALTRYRLNCNFATGACVTRPLPKRECPAFGRALGCVVLSADQFVKWYVVPKKAVLSIEVFGARTVNTPAL